MRNGREKTDEKDYYTPPPRQTARQKTNPLSL